MPKTSHIMYYKLDFPAGTKETGPKYPQTHCITQQDAFKLKSNVNIDFVPNLEFMLESKAKLTDVLSDGSISAIGILCNEKTLNLLKEFNLQKHHLYPAQIHTVTSTIQYFWLQCISTDILEFIDFPKSEFYRLEHGFPTNDQFTLNSYEDYLQKRKEFGIMSLIQAKTISLLPKYKHDLDFFCFPIVDRSIYVSESLSKSLKGNKVTGIKTVPAENLI